VDLERSPHQILDEVDLGTVQQAERDIIDDDGDAVSLEHKIIRVPLVVEGEAVLEPRASAAGDGDPQECIFCLFLIPQNRNATRGILGQNDLAVGDIIHTLGHVVSAPARRLAPASSQIYVSSRSSPVKRCRAAAIAGEAWMMRFDGTQQQRIANNTAGPLPGDAAWQPVP
jgi:hypothetical protein